MTPLSTHTIAPTQAIELQKTDGLWHFQMFERGTELWTAEEAGAVLGGDQTPIRDCQDAIDAACFRLADRVRDVDLVIQVVGFDATVRTDGSVRLEAPGIGEFRDLRDGLHEDLELPLLMHVHLDAALPTGDPRSVDDVYFTARVAPGFALRLPRRDAAAAIPAAAAI